jgi:ABC-type branched-subunit amino acid transport system ATPase component/ABC-type branched-subunit amino acid transport system permease subunit
LDQVIVFVLLGLGAGAMYALAGLGVVLVYRGSGVVNFAQGAIGISGAYVYYELYVVHQMGAILSFVLSVLASAVIGVLTQMLVMHRLRHASSLVRLVATLGVLLVLQAIALLHYGSVSVFVPSALPTTSIKITPQIAVGEDQIYLLVIAAILTLVLALLYRRTNFGRATTAVAENQRIAASLGWSPRLIASANWAIGSALGGIAAILIVSIVGLQVSILTNVTIYALAIALVGGFSSFPITLLAGLLLGILQSLVVRYAGSVIGLSDALPIAIIVAVLVVTGRSLPLRGSILDRLPSVGSGRIRAVPAIIAVAAGVGIILALDASWVSAVTASLTLAIIMLSVVVLTGYAGQLSLGQIALAGMGAYVCGRLDAGAHLPLPLAFLIAVAAAVPIGIVFGLPALRTRGVNLAILTMGLGLAIGSVIFSNINLTGPDGFDSLSSFSLFGFSFSPVTHPDRYAILVLFWFVLLALAVANVRRSRVGRRLLAIRTNERAATSLGINVLEGKLFAFVLATVIASVGGILTAYAASSVSYTVFDDPIGSINTVALTVIGGVGYVIGPLFGSVLAPGGLGNQIGDFIFSQSFTQYLPLIGGIVFILVLLRSPDGMAPAHGKLFESKAFSRLQLRRAPAVMRKVSTGGATLARASTSPSNTGAPAAITELPRPAAAVVSSLAPEAIEETLELRNIVVRFGGLVAVDGASFEVRTGRTTGLIGANGAGKTTVIDVLTGFTKPSAGELLFNGKSMTKMSPTKRARVGITRTFQSLELFDDMTVAENLLAASEPRDRLSYLVSMVSRGRRDLPPHVMRVVSDFGLEADLDRPVKDLAYAQRRLVAIARAVATRPSILLLDEPVAGLSNVESAELARVIRRLVKESGIGVLLVEHDMEFVMGLCDDVVVLDFGKLIAHDVPARVQNDPGVLAAYLGEDKGLDAETAGATDSSSGMVL